MKGLNPSKALGPDELHPRLLKALATELGPIFVHLVQQSIDSGEIPKEWTLANISPLFKKGGRSLACNYRPVCLTLQIHINDITADIESEIRLFADDCVFYREIKGKEGTLKLQRDIDRLGNWARKWGMRFQPVKCNMMQLARKHLNKIQASYTLEGAVLENVDNIKYLGVTITNDLKWNTHISNICTKANRSLGFLRQILFSCPQNVKEAAYKGMLRPISEYGSSVWDPHTDKLQEELEKVQSVRQGL